MSADGWWMLLTALWETVLMTLVSGGVSFVLGVPLGVLLCITRRGDIWEHRWLNTVIGGVVNAARSLPFIILLVAVVPFTRWVVGTSIGTMAAIVPLTLAAIPFVARIAEGAISEVPRGLVEMAQSMGSSRWQIVTKVLLPEARSGLIHGLTITLVTLVGYSAMAGAIGGGGLGDLGIRYGYQRFDAAVMMATVVVLIVLVQLIQTCGDAFLNRFSRDR